MKLPTLSVPTLLLAIVLPIACALVYALLFTFGGIAQVGPLPDLLVYVTELPVRTVYAIAVFGAAALVMRWTGLNHNNDVMLALWAQASEAGERGAAARWTLALQALCWAGAIVAAIVAFRGLG